MAMTDSQYYGGSMQEAVDAWRTFALRERAIANGFTVRHEQRGGETVIIITPSPLPNGELTSGAETRDSGRNP